MTPGHHHGDHYHAVPGPQLHAGQFSVTAEVIQPPAYPYECGGCGVGTGNAGTGSVVNIYVNVDQAAQGGGCSGCGYGTGQAQNNSVVNVITGANGAARGYAPVGQCYNCAPPYNPCAHQVCGPSTSYPKAGSSRNVATDGDVNSTIGVNQTAQ